MAIMLNMLPVEQKPNTVVQNTNNKCGTKNTKPGVGFAKVLTDETDKNEVDTDANGKNNDNAQLMAAMAGLVAPVVLNVVPLNQVVDTVIDGLEETVTNTQNQLLDLVPGGATPKVSTVIVVPPQAEVPNTVVQLANTKNGSVENQVVTNVSNGQQAQLLNIADSMDTSKQPLATVVGQMTAVNPQVDNKQLGDDMAQWQTKLQNMQNVGQVQGNDKKNTDAVLANPAVVNALSITPSVTDNGLLKNGAKQLDPKKIVADQVNLDMKNVGVVTSIDVKPVLATQVVVPVIDELLGKDKENSDIILSNQPAKDSDAFASILNQQGMKIGQQVVMSEVKQVIAQPVADPYNITSQIVDQARLVAGSKNTEMIIQLKPEHLGELTFKVSVENGVVSASFHSNNADVRNMIESSLYQLKQEMSNQGLKIDNVGVYAGLGEFFSNGQQREGQQQPATKVHHNTTEEEFIEALESIDPTKSSVDGSGVDYRI